jgi:hypothetical protein
MIAKCYPRPTRYIKDLLQSTPIQFRHVFTQSDYISLDAFRTMGCCGQSAAGNLNAYFLPDTSTFNHAVPEEIHALHWRRSNVQLSKFLPCKSVWLHGLH